MTRYWTRQMEQSVSGRGPSRAAAGLSPDGLLLWGARRIMVGFNGGTYLKKQGDRWFLREFQIKRS
jgi:hypothetical protein